VVRTGSLAHCRNSWDDNPDLSGLKISWEIARAFVMSPVLTVLLPDFLNGGSDGNHDVAIIFVISAIISVFNSFYVTFCAND
jgi:hypothetical protein